MREALHACEQALGLRPDHAELHRLRLLTMLYDEECSEGAFLEAQREHARRCPAGPRAAPLSRAAGERLRVGYLSSDLRDHPVGHNVAPLIQNHDPRRVELFLYADHAGDDPVAESLRRRAEHWVEVSHLDDDALRRRMLGDRLHVLTFLAGHLDRNRLRLAASRLAPVQISMHDVASSALPEMDFWMTDGFLHPAGHDEPFSERLVRLPVFYCYLPPEDAGPVAAPTVGGTPRFGSFSNPAKLNDRVLDLWSRLLRAVPGATLTLAYTDVFGAAEARSEYAGRLATRGVEPDRLRFLAGRTCRRDHLARYAEIDVALDPFPFNGATTTFEALWMGVPVVTLLGRRFVSRAAGSILHAAGLDELVAPNQASYLDIATRLVADPARLARLRNSLRARLAGGPLCDGPRYARGMERLLEVMVRSAR